MTDVQPVDIAEREQAIQTDRSFIVKAPAGSGKTGLLVQRILALLGTVERPESVVAMTFTIKAGAEMRERVVRALREAEEMVRQFTVLYPDEMLLRTALRGAVAYQLSWFDAHFWAYAEHFGLSELLSEDFQHDRLYGSVRAVNPFL